MTDQHTEAATVVDHRVELRKEALTMALYVAICLLAASIALPETEAGHLPVVGIIWGVSVGLALAHWFAFRVSARLVGAGRVRGHDLESAAAQLLGAGAVAVLATLAVILVPADAELQAVELVLAGFVAIVGYGVARGGNASRPRALAYSAAVLVIAVAIAVVKNTLAGH